MSEDDVQSFICRASAKEEPYLRKLAGVWQHLITDKEGEKSGIS